MTWPTPDPRWIPFLKIGLGYLIVISALLLALAISLGHVEEKSSFGLIIILNILSGIAGGFSVWAFTSTEVVVKGEDK